MSQVTVAAEARHDAGKGVARKLRAQGRIPGVLYGRDANATLFSVEEKDMYKLMKEHGLNVILQLELDGKTHSCMIAEYQKDVFDRHLLHIDLKLVKLTDKVVVKVPINLLGQNAVRSRGGIAQLYMREFKVKVLATDIPKSIDLDISEMSPGMNRKLKEIELGDNLQKMNPPETVVINILAPRAMAVVAAVDDDEDDEDEEAAAE
jgi:large subunit ribosomal protein L25